VTSFHAACACFYEQTTIVPVLNTLLNGVRGRGGTRNVTRNWITVANTMEDTTTCQHVQGFLFLTATFHNSEEIRPVCTVVFFFQSATMQQKLQGIEKIATIIRAFNKLGRCKVVACHKSDGHLPYRRAV